METPEEVTARIAALREELRTIRARIAANKARETEIIGEYGMSGELSTLDGRLQVAQQYDAALPTVRVRQKWPEREVVGVVRRITPKYLYLSERGCMPFCRAVGGEA